MFVRVILWVLVGIGAIGAFLIGSALFARAQKTALNKPAQKLLASVGLNVA